MIFRTLYLDITIHDDFNFLEAWNLTMLIDFGFSDIEFVYNMISHNISLRLGILIDFVTINTWWFCDFHFWFSFDYNFNSVWIFWFHDFEFWYICTWRFSSDIMNFDDTYIFLIYFGLWLYITYGYWFSWDLEFWYYLMFLIFLRLLILTLLTISIFETLNFNIAGWFDFHERLWISTLTGIMIFKFGHH